MVLKTLALLTFSKMSAGEKKHISAPAWLMEFTANASESFVTAYYAASESPQRGSLLPSLYLPNSSISWNGNPISGATQYKQWLETHPGSQHEIQSFDCHPLGPFDAYGTYNAYGYEACARSNILCEPTSTPLLSSLCLESLIPVACHTGIELAGATRICGLADTLVVDGVTASTRTRCA